MHGGYQYQSLDGFQRGNVIVDTALRVPSLYHALPTFGLGNLLIPVPTAEVSSRWAGCHR
jgi:hypothetical protein